MTQCVNIHDALAMWFGFVGFVFGAAAMCLFYVMKIKR